jgi:uncharacterized protein (UPF0262 family)
MSLSIIPNLFFYHHNQFLKKFNINFLQSFMLTKNTKIEYLNKMDISGLDIAVQEDTEVIPEEEKVSVLQEEKMNFIEPRHLDTLFWCLYIITHGYKDYIEIDRNYGVKELEEKQKISEFIKTNINKIKNTNYKITNVAIQEMLSEFLTVQKNTSILCLIAMTVYYNINILIIDSSDKTMLEFWANKDGVPQMDRLSEENAAMTYVLYKNENGKYKLRIENISTSRIYEMKEKYLVLESYLKPIRAMASYKVEELEQMAKKLGVFDETKKYKKNELYELVQGTITSFI